MLRNVNVETDNWRGKYQQMVREFDAAEHRWRELEHILRRIIGRLCLAADNGDERLHGSLDALARASRAPAGLGGKVNHAVELLGGEELFHAFPVGHVEFHETEILVGRKAGQTIELELDFVIIVEVVETDDFVASRQKNLAGVHADKTGGAGNENFHGRGYVRFVGIGARPTGWNKSESARISVAFSHVLMTR